MHGSTAGRPIVEGHLHFPADIIPLSTSLCGSETPGTDHLCGDLADGHLAHWELAWIDLGGEG
jgi:hypothetical protein